MAINQVCLSFGHNWIVTIRNGRPVELCANCNSLPTDNPYLAIYDDTTGGN